MSDDVWNEVEQLWKSSQQNDVSNEILYQLIQESQQRHQTEKASTKETPKESDVIHISNNYYSISGKNTDLVLQVQDIMKHYKKELDESNTDVFSNGYFLCAKMLLAHYYSVLLSIPERYFHAERYQKIVIDTIESIDHPELLDGGIQSCHIFHPSREHLYPHSPVLIIFPGLNQTYHSFNILIKNYIEEKKWSVVVINRRGIDSELMTPVYFSFGNKTDTAQMLRYLKSRSEFQSRPFFALGFSIGGFVLTSYLASYYSTHDRELDGLFCAATISSPLDPKDVHIFEAFIHSGLMNDMKFSFLQPFVTYTPQLSNYTKEKQLISDQEIQQEEQELQRLTHLRDSSLRTNNIFEFMVLNILMFDRKNSKWKEFIEKYNSSELTHLIHTNDEKVWNCFQDLIITDKIQNNTLPLLSICSNDDIIVRLSSKSFKAFFKSPNQVYVLTKTGGHCLFKKSIFTNNISVADHIVYDFFQIFLSK